MSTNSGEAGFCKFCGHLMNVHTAASHSKCKKCKKRIHVCQAGVHNEGDGWRLCDVPCGCGSRHYPSTARQACPLAPTEYASSHPQYESPPEDETLASHSTPEASRTSPGNPNFVDVTNNGHYLQFYGHDGELISTVREHWQQTSILYQGVEVGAWQMVDDTGLSYFTWTLDAQYSQDAPAEAEQSERSLGKQVAHAPQSTSHGRTLSAESIDPLQWSEEQFDMTSAIAGLTIGERVAHAPQSTSHGRTLSAESIDPLQWSEERLGGGSSSQVHQVEDLSPGERVLGSARLGSKKGTVVFKPQGDGEKVTSLRKRWVKVEGGFIFESKSHRCTFFTKEIKPAKK